MRRVAIFVIILFALVAFINAYSTAKTHASQPTFIEKPAS